MLGLQPRPTVGEVAAYLLYAVPMALFVLWPRTARGRRRRREAHALGMATAARWLVARGARRRRLRRRRRAGSAGANGAPRRPDLKVTLTDDGCDARRTSTLAAGPTTFEVTNGGSAKVDRVRGPRRRPHPRRGREHRRPASAARSRSTSSRATTPVAARAAPGRRRAARCVTAAGGAAGAGRRAARPPSTATARYVEPSRPSSSRTAAFVAAVKAGDVDRAKALYAPARIPYERIEPVAESFGDLDPAIDARDDDVPRRAVDRLPRDRAGAVGRRHDRGPGDGRRQLVADVSEARRRWSRPLELEPAQLANGAVELLDEVSKSKITGEEERYSHIDLVDFGPTSRARRPPTTASRRSCVARTTPALAATIEQRFAAVDAALAPPPAAATASSLYDDADHADTRAAAQPSTRSPSRSRRSRRRSSRA